MDERFAVNCNADTFLHEGHETLTDEATDLLRHSLAPATERALRGDLTQFQEWGGSLPTTPATVCAYIGDHAGHHAVATIQRRVASISKAHEMAGLPNPVRAEIVKATLRGLRRKHGTAQRQAKPLMRDDLLLVLDSLGKPCATSAIGRCCFWALPGASAAPNWWRWNGPTLKLSGKG